MYICTHIPIAIMIITIVCVQLQMSYIDDFTEKDFFTYLNELMSSQIVSDVFAEITNDTSDIVYACKNARSVGLNKKFLAVIDGGFFDKQKLQEIHYNEEDQGFTYSLNRDKEITARKYFGYFAIFTTDANATPNDIITHYREKDIDEKMFYDIKVYMNGRRPQNKENF